MSPVRSAVLLVSGLLLVAACTAAPAATTHVLATLESVPTLNLVTPSATPTSVPTATPAAPPLPTPTPAASNTPTTPPASGSTGIAGEWTGTYSSTKFDGSNGGFTVTFTQIGDVIAGKIVVDSSCVGRGTINGNASGDTITFGVVKAAENIAFDGQLSGNSLSGNYTTGPGCGNDKGTWSATRNT